MRIRIRWQGGAVEANLDDTPTTRLIAEALPCTAAANTWGEEVYFELPVAATLDSSPRQVVEPGTVCFWVQGSAMAIPYGPTPISEGKECRLVTACNVLGRVDGDPRRLGAIRAGLQVTVEAIGD